MVLRAYQKSGAAFLASRKKALLGDEPGLGKTRTALHATHLIGAERIGVICPAIVRPQWWKEAATMGVQLTTVASYNGLVDNGPEHIPQLDVLIGDEIHFTKHRHSQRAKAFFALARRVLDNGGRVWTLSGTPMPRNPGELYGLAVALWPKTVANMGLGNYVAWLNRFTRWKASRYGIKVYGAQNVPMLREFLDKVMLRRLVRDVAPDLPGLRFGTISLDVPSVAGILLAEAELDPGLRDALSRGELPPMSPQLARYRHQIGDLKAPVAAALLRDELLSEPETTKKVVFAYHRSVLDKLEQELAPFGVVRIDGATSPSQREERKRQFETIPARRVFLGQIEACGTGLDGLQYVANDAVIVEPEWKSDLNEQAPRRLARMGQSLPVLCRFLSLAGSLDDAIVRSHEREVRMRVEVTG
jgi:SNF2 family DNA or RNA helicase